MLTDSLQIFYSSTLYHTSCNLGSILVNIYCDPIFKYINSTIFYLNWEDFDPELIVSTIKFKEQLSA